MKTPEEIKKGLECRIRGINEKCDYHCDKCDMFIPGYNLENCYSDALAYIQQLESRLAQAERERDAAVADAKLGTACDTCWYNENPERPNPCRVCGGGFPNWQWRGVCPENTKEE